MLSRKILPTASQLTIIDKYSHRVRELTIMDMDSTSVHFLQCMCRQPSFLLPNLRVLQWNPDILIPHLPIGYIQKLLSPTLVSLRTNLAEVDGEVLLSFFDNYPLLCRNLKSVEFRFSARGSVTEVTIHALFSRNL